MIDCYNILGVPPGAALEEIRPVYLALVKKYHTDTHKSGWAATKFYEINEAWSVIKDAERRAELDLWLRMTRIACSSCGGTGTVMESHGWTGADKVICDRCNGAGWRRK